MADKVVLSLAVAYSLLITALSLIQLGDLSVGSFSPTDKLLHALAYFFLAAIWFFYLIVRNQGNHQKIAGYLKISVIITLFGMFIEVLQGTLTSYRQPDWSDILANTTGIFLALLFFIIFKSFLYRVKDMISSFL